MAASVNKAASTCEIVPPKESSRTAAEANGAPSPCAARVEPAATVEPSRTSSALRARHSRLNLAVDVSLVSFLLLVDGLGNAPDPSGLPALLLLTLLVVAAWVLTGSALGYYDGPAKGRKPLDDAALAATMVLGTMLLAAAFNLATPLSPPFRRALLLCWPLTMLVRIAFFRTSGSQKRPVEQALIVGTGPLASITAEDLERRGRQRVIGHLFFPDEARSHVLRPPFLGTWMDLESSLRTKPVDEVYIVGDGPAQAPAVQHAISVCEELGVPFALPAYTFRLQRARPVSGKAVADGYLHYAVVGSSAPQRAVKRICDLLIASVALWLLAPLFLVVAAFIKATSRGPVFFKQVRCGLHGQTFEMIKFRSMLADAEQRRKTLEMLNERCGPVFKMRNDPRVTPVGAVLRKFSIDELPQIINVLRGEMSIVGPRPPLPDEVAKYHPWQLRRLSVRPGLTCIWQIASGRHQMSFEEWMYLDLQYVDHFSLLKDMEIIVRTLPVVATGSGEPARAAGAARYNVKVSVR